MTEQPISKVLSQLKHKGAGVDKQWLAFCPCHDDKKESLSVAQAPDGRVLLKCFAGCQTEDIARAIGLEMKDLYPRRGDERRQKPGGGGYSPVVARYFYQNETGQVIYRKDRFQDKRFFQYRRDDLNGKLVPGIEGKWISGLKGVRQTLYRLPQLIEAIKVGRLIWICEGEKDTDKLIALGEAATTSGGAESWRHGFASYFAGARVAVIADDDEPGHKQARRIGNDLVGVAKSVKVILSLPGTNKKGYDVSDFLNAGGTIEGLQALSEQSAEWEPEPVPDERQEKRQKAQQRRDSETARLLYLVEATGQTLTDSGNAERFVQQHGRDVRFCHDWNKWLIWDGQRWREDKTGAIFRLAKQTARELYRLAADCSDSEQRKKIGEFAQFCESRGRLEALVKLAQNEAEISVLSNDLDKDDYLLNCTNGTVNLRTGELRPHRRENLITKLCPVEFNPAARCERWTQFIQEITDSRQELAWFLQKAMGYSMTGDCREQVFFMHSGDGENGKSKLIETIEAILGEYFVTTPVDSLLTGRNDGGQGASPYTAALQGSRFVFCSEPPKGRGLNESLVKQLSGNDSISCRRLHCEPITFKPAFKLHMLCNDKPVISGTDGGIWRRVRVVPYGVKFTKEAGNRDDELLSKLLAELPGILTWLVEGCLAWQREGLGMPEEVKAATDGYRTEMDIISAFVEECCITGMPEFKAKSSELYAGYAQWCGAGKEKQLNQRAFGAELSKRGFKRTKTCGANVWHGIGLQQANEEPAHWGRAYGFNSR